MYVIMDSPNFARSCPAVALPGLVTATGPQDDVSQIFTQLSSDEDDKTPVAWNILGSIPFSQYNTAESIAASLLPHFSVSSISGDAPEITL